MTSNGMTSEALRLKGFKEVAGGRFERVKAPRAGETWPAGWKPEEGTNKQTQNVTIKEGKAVASRRVRQSSKPLMNRLEADFMARQQARYPHEEFIGQGIRFKIGANAWYKPDLVAFIGGTLFCWECKGPKKMKGVARGVLALKCAAAAWPAVCFTLVWREHGDWFEQKILSE